MSNDLRKRARRDGFLNRYNNGYATYQEAWAIYWNSFQHGRRIAFRLAKRNARKGK